MSAAIDLRAALERLSSDARDLAQPAIERFEGAMIQAELAIDELRACGFDVSVRHPMQARQTMRDTHLLVSLPAIRLDPSSRTRV